MDKAILGFRAVSGLHSAGSIVQRAIEGEQEANPAQKGSHTRYVTLDAVTAT